MLKAFGLNPLAVALISLALFVALLYRMLRGVRDQYYDDVREAAKAATDEVTQNTTVNGANTAEHDSKTIKSKQKRTPTLNVANQAWGILAFTICGCFGAYLYIKIFMYSDFSYSNAQLEKEISNIQKLTSISFDAIKSLLFRLQKESVVPTMQSTVWIAFFPLLAGLVIRSFYWIICLVVAFFTWLFARRTYMLPDYGRWESCIYKIFKQDYDFTKEEIDENNDLLKGLFASLFFNFFILFTNLIFRLHDPNDYNTENVYMAYATFCLSNTFAGFIWCDTWFHDLIAFALNGFRYRNMNHGQSFDLIWMLFPITTLTTALDELVQQYSDLKRHLYVAYGIFLIAFLGFAIFTIILSTKKGKPIVDRYMKKHGTNLFIGLNSYARKDCYAYRMDFKDKKSTFQLLVCVNKEKRDQLFGDSMEVLLPKHLDPDKPYCFDVSYMRLFYPQMSSCEKQAVVENLFDDWDISNEKMNYPINRKRLQEILWKLKKDILFPKDDDSKEECSLPKAIRLKKEKPNKIALEEGVYLVQSTCELKDDPDINSSAVIRYPIHFIIGDRQSIRDNGSASKTMVFI